MKIMQGTCVSILCVVSFAANAQDKAVKATTSGSPKTGPRRCAIIIGAGGLKKKVRETR